MTVTRVVSRRSYVKTAFTLRQHFRRSLPPTIRWLEEGIWSSRKSFTEPHLIRRFGVRISRTSSVIKCFASPVHGLCPKFVSLRQLYVVKQHFSLNTSRHCSRLNNAQASLCNTIVLGTVSRGELLIDQKFIAQGFKFSTEKLTAIVRPNKSTNYGFPSARTLAR